MHNIILGGYLQTGEGIEPAALGLIRTTRAVLTRTKARLYVDAVNQDRRKSPSRRNLLANSHLKSAMTSMT